MDFHGCGNTQEELKAMIDQEWSSPAPSKDVELLKIQMLIRRQADVSESDYQPHDPTEE
jgi:hypothetical protein